MFLYISPHRDDIRRSGSLAVLMDDQQYCLRSHEIVHAVDERPSFLLSFFLALQVKSTAFNVETHFKSHFVAAVLSTCAVEYTVCS